MSDKRVLAVRHSRNERYRKETAAQLHDLAELIEAMSVAMDDGDDILGALAGQGLVNHLPALPKNVRDVFMENLTDEAARGYRADVAYMARREAALPESPKKLGGAVSREGET